MSSCCISVMYDPNAVLRHTTPHTLLPYCSKHPLRLFHSTCQTVIHLSLSPLSQSLPPSHLLYLFTHPYISLPYCIHHFTLSSWAFLQLCFPRKEHNIEHSLLGMLYMHQYTIFWMHQCNVGCIVWNTARRVVRGRDVQLKQYQSTKGVCHICPLCRAALTESDDSFHQWHWSVWQPVKEIGEKVPLKFHKVTVHLNNITCQFNASENWSLLREEGNEVQRLKM